MTMTKTLLILVAAGALISLACFSLLGVMDGMDHVWPWHSAMESGPRASRDLPFVGSERLDIGYPAEITVTQGAQPRFTVAGPKDLIDRLSLDGGALKAPDDRGFWFGQRPGKLKIDIVSPNTHEF